MNLGNKSYTQPSRVPVSWVWKQPQFWNLNDSSTLHRCHRLGMWMTWLHAAGEGSSLYPPTSWCDNIPWLTKPPRHPQRLVGFRSARLGTAKCLFLESHIFGKWRPRSLLRPRRAHRKWVWFCFQGFRRSFEYNIYIYIHPIASISGIFTYVYRKRKQPYTIDWW